MNKIILTGRLTADPKVFDFKKGKEKKSVAKFSIAVNNYNNEATFFNCSAFNKLCGVVLDYCIKGQLVLIVGYLDITEKDDKSYMNVIVTELEFLSPPKKEDEEDEEDEEAKKSNKKKAKGAH